jgi:thiopurine S-methyltransferase
MDDREEWFARWRDNRIGFHEGRPNTYLERHADRLDAGRRVLVPLCGKSEDLAFLAGRGHPVVGVELVEDAVRAFFAEHDLTPRVTSRGPFTAYAAGAITILAGDIFDATADLLGPVDALYDRAALIALPPEVRSRYVAHLRALLPAGAAGLVITLEYPEDEMAGPPFSVREPEVRALYAGAELQLLDEGPARGGKCQEKGLPGSVKCFRVRLP